MKKEKCVFETFSIHLGWSILVDWAKWNKLKYIEKPHINIVRRYSFIESEILFCFYVCPSSFYPPYIVSHVSRSVVTEGKASLRHEINPLKKTRFASNRQT